MPLQRQLTIEDGIAILRKRWLLLAALAIVGASLGYQVARMLPKRFTSQTVVLVQQPTVPGDYVKAVVSEDVNQRMASMQQEILSRTRLEPVIKQFGLYPGDIDRVSMEDLVDRLRKAVLVTPIAPMAETRSQGLPGFTVAVTLPDPRVAQEVCSAVTTMFMEENTKLRQAHAEQTTQFLSGQLDDAKAKLDAQDSKLADFKRRYLGSLPDEEQTNLNVLTGLTSQLDATTQALSRAQQDKGFVESLLSQQVTTLQATQNGQNPDTLDQQLAALQTQLTTLKSRYTDSYPDVIKVQRDIESLKKKIADSASNVAPATDVPAKAPTEPAQTQVLRTQIFQYDQMIKEKTAQQEQIQAQIKLYQSRVQSSPAIEQEYKGLTRDYQTALEFYNDLLKKRDQSAMATDLEKDQQGEQFQVLDPANLPNAPSFPKKGLFVMGGFGGGLGLGLAFGLLMELQDTSLRSEKEVEALLHLPVLAMVPAIKGAIASKKPPSLRASV